jgi:hypothetical protein
VCRRFTERIVKVKQFPVWLPGVAGFIAWSAVFAIVYAQSPLYTANQNTYFLHGLARAGLGNLSQDWLANTLDSLPLFSGLVFITYSIFHSGVPFYLYYALLMGVYLAGMLGIADVLFDLRRSRTRTLVFLALFLGIHSAAFHYTLSRVIGTERPFLLEGGVAAQRVLGQVFQPSTFGVFLVLSLYVFLRRKPFLALLPLAAAVYFHPVYLLSGALLVLAFMWLIFREGRDLLPPVKFGAAALLLVAPCVAYTAYAFWPTSLNLAQKANKLLVTYRIPHHTIVAQWLDWTVVVQVAVVLAAMLIVRRTRLFHVLFTLTLATLLLTLIQVWTGSYTLALLYPWRTSVLLVPVSTTIVLAFGVTKAMERRDVRPAGRSRRVDAAGLAFIAILIAVGWIRFRVESALQLADASRPMMAFVASHQTAGETYLIPPKLSDFRLVTGAPVFIDSYSIPYHDVDFLEWYRRVRRANVIYRKMTESCAELPEFVRREGITRAVLPVESSVPCGDYPVVYRDDHYIVYSVK